MSFIDQVERSFWQENNFIGVNLSSLRCLPLVDYSEIQQKMVSSNPKERKEAASKIGSTFSVLENKEQASKDLLELTKDLDSYVRWGAVCALGSVFQYLTDKEQASKDLLELTKDQNRDVRWSAADALGSVFQYLPDKEQASKYLLALTKDQDETIKLECNLAFLI